MNRLGSEVSRNNSIDTLRAIACFALVAYHVIGSGPRVGLELPLEHAFQVLNQSGEIARMPLFSFLSGLVLAPAVTTRHQLNQSILKRTRRLLMPMLVVTTLFWLVRGVLITSNQASLIYVLTHSWAHFWFIQAIFCVNIVFYILIYVSGGRSRAVAAALLLMASLAYAGASISPPTFMSLKGALFLAPFFLLGFLCKPLLPMIGHSNLLLRALGLGMLFEALALGWVVNYEPGEVNVRIIKLIGGAGACFGLLIVAPSSRILAWIGQRSFAIYLFHVFFTAAVIETARRFAPDAPTELVFAASLTAGVVGPTALQMAVERHGPARLLLLGLPLKDRAPRKQPLAAVA